MQVPGNDIPLVIEYLAGIRGGAREASALEFIVVDDSEFNRRSWLRSALGNCQ